MSQPPPLGLPVVRKTRYSDPSRFFPGTGSGHGQPETLCRVSCAYARRVPLSRTARCHGVTALQTRRLSAPPPKIYPRPL
jgi:hypothetical protein